jgi:hypothetical protein
LPASSVTAIQSRSLSESRTPLMLAPMASAPVVAPLAE